MIDNPQSKKVSGQVLAAVRLGNKWGYIDQTGKCVVHPLFDSAWNFEEGLAAVNVGGSGWPKIGGKWGYTDKIGKFVIEPQFDGTWGFSQGLAPVQTKGKYRAINRGCPGIW